MGSRNSKAREIFLEAIEKHPPDQWDQFADAACGEDHDLRQRVKRLLRSEQQLGPFREAMAASPTTIGASDLPRPSALAGTHIGPYMLVQQIGEGGMGEVWVAKQTQPVKRKVAIKLIKPGMDSKAVLTRFEQERQALAMMDHPNIARVLDAGLTKDHRPFFVMELVNGLPLNVFCDQAKLGIHDRLKLFVPICQAVQHAHQKGIIHRDLKPSNILVTVVDGQPIPKVIDFGVAKVMAGRLTDESVFTQFGAAVGTLEYMSPEQAGYCGEDIDTRSDIYSLGVLLYELLTGLRPIDAKRLKNLALTEMMRVIREEEPSKPSTRLSADASLPSLAAIRQTEPRRLTSLLRGELDWVVMKCLEKQRDRRYETASALSRDLLRYLSDEPVEARPPSTAYRLRKFLYRHKHGVVAAGLATVAVAALVGTAIATGMYAKAERERTAEAAASLLANEAKDRETLLRARAEAAASQAAESEERVRQVLYAADIQLAWSHWNANEIGKMLELLQNHIPSAEERDDRGFEWHYLWRLANSSQRTLQTLPQPVQTLAFAGSDGVLLSGDLEYQYRRPGTVRKWPLTRAETPLTLFSQSESPDRAAYYSGIRSLAASPSGDRCALTDGHFVRVVSTETGESLQEFEIANADCRSVAFSPDGRRIAVGDFAGQITLCDTQTGAMQPMFEKHQFPIVSLAYSPDGKLLAAGGGDESAPTWSELLNGELKLWNVENGELVGQCAAVRSLLRNVCFHPQGTNVAAATSEGTVVIWDLGRLEGGRILRGHTGPVNAVCWLSDGRFLASGGADGLIRVWDIGREQDNHVLKGHQGAVTALAVAPQGQLLASADREGTIRIWDPHVDPLRTVISDFPWSIGSVDFSADNRWLVIGNYQQVTVCDTERFEKQRVLPIDHWVFDTDVSHDGRLIATAGNQGMDGKEPGIVQIWDLVSGAKRHTLNPQVISARRVAFSADGRRLACLGRSSSRGEEEHVVTLWDVAKGALLSRHVGAVSFDFSADSTHLILAGNRGVWLVPTDDGLEKEVRLVRRPCRAVLTAPNGRDLAVHDDQGQLSLWSLSDAREQPLGIATSGITFSPNGRRVAAFGESATQIWDVKTGKLLATIPKVGTKSLFSPDGLTFVTAGEEVQLWQTETGRELLNLGKYQPSGVRALSMSPSGEWLAAGGGYRDEHSGVWVWLGPMGDAQSPTK